LALVQFVLLVVCTIDLAANFAALAGASLPDDGFLDSLDVSQALLGRTGREAATTSCNRTTAPGRSAYALAPGS
jgi:hypothetical protein